MVSTTLRSVRFFCISRRQRIVPNRREIPKQRWCNNYNSSVVNGKSRNLPPADCTSSHRKSISCSTTDQIPLAVPISSCTSVLRNRACNSNVNPHGIFHGRHWLSYLCSDSLILRQGWRRPILRVKPPGSRACCSISQQRDVLLVNWCRLGSTLCGYKESTTMSVFIASLWMTP